MDNLYSLTAHKLLEDKVNPSKIAISIAERIKSVEPKIKAFVKINQTMSTPGVDIGFLPLTV